MLRFIDAHVETTEGLCLFPTASVTNYHQLYDWGFPGGSEGKASACNTGDLGPIPELGRSPGEGNDNALQYSCLENPMDRGAWRATVHGVIESDMTERLHSPTHSLIRLSTVEMYFLTVLEIRISWKLYGRIKTCLFPTSCGYHQSLVFFGL